MLCYYTYKDTPDEIREWHLKRNAHSHRSDRTNNWRVSGISKSLLDLMCECVNDDFGPKTPTLIIDSEKKLSFCGRCRKLPWHYLQLCGHCGKFFVKDFKDPRYCVWIPTCWFCTQEKPIHIECRHLGPLVVESSLKPQLTRSTPRPKFDFGDDFEFTLD